MLKIKSEVDLDVLLKYGFKKVQQDKRINYVLIPKDSKWSCGNCIVVNNDRNLFNYDYYIDEDRNMEFQLNPNATYEFEEIIDGLYDLIADGLVEKE